MTLTSRQLLDVVELAYYVIALPLSVFLVLKHGYGRHLGWMYLATLSLLRIIGAGTGIASVDHPSSKDLLETSIICESIGISPLLLASLGLVDRVNDGIQGYGISKNFSRMIHIPIIVGLILAIISGVKSFSSNPSTVIESHQFLEAASILYVLGLAGITFICITLLGRRQSTVQGETRLLYAVMLSLPLILVRIIYTIITAFDHDSSTFSIVSTTHAAVIVQGIMSVLMEFIVVAIYITVGFSVGKVARHLVRGGYQGHVTEYNGAGKEPPI